MVRFGGLLPPLPCLVVMLPCYCLESLDVPALAYFINYGPGSDDLVHFPNGMVIRQKRLVKGNDLKEGPTFQQHPTNFSNSV